MRRTGINNQQDAAQTQEVRLQTDLQEGRISPAYLFIGEEEFLIARATTILVNSLLPSDARDFNFVSLDGDKLTLEAFADAVRSFPLFSSIRLTVVRKAELLSASVAEQVADGLDSLAPGVVVAFTAVVSEKEDKLKKLAAKVSKVGTVLRFPRLKEADAALWLVRFARSELAVEVPLNVSRELVASVGTDLRLLASELEKLCVFAGKRKRITSEDAAQVGGRIPLSNVFQLIDAVGKGEAAACLSHLADLYALGQPEAYLLHMLAWHFRNLLLVKELLDAGVQSPEDIATKTGLALYPARKAASQARLFSEKDLIEALALVLAAGVRMRQHRLDSQVTMQTLLLRLCRAKEKAL